MHENRVLRKEINLTDSKDSKPIVPEWLIWVQCIAFVVLYAVWILPEVVGFRNTALIVGALAGLYPIYQYRCQLLQKSAVPIWLICVLFVWATLHLLFFYQDYAAQLIEFKRIWKYAVIGSIFAFGLGLSLMSAASDNSIKQLQGKQYWRIIFFGLCTPVLIYLIKYALTTYGVRWGIQPPAYLQIGLHAQRYYVPKTDYVAFCLPPMFIALGQILTQLNSTKNFRMHQWSGSLCYVFIVAATLFLFYNQDIKNGFAYSVFGIGIFFLVFLFGSTKDRVLQRFVFVSIAALCLIFGIIQHVQKNDSWKTLAADTEVALQTERYEHWKYAGEKGYPNNEYGRRVSITNYERVAWFKIGLLLTQDAPLGFGLVEDSFKKIAMARWPEVSPNLSHSHSGWLDLILAVGLPGFLFLSISIALVLRQSRVIFQPWKNFLRWALFANISLWITTEVSATVTFAALIFWVSWCSGLVLLGTPVGACKPKAR